VSNWCVDNGMSIATSKCGLLRVGPGSVDYCYKINDCPINTVEVMKDLGIIMSSNMKFLVHIDFVLKTAASIVNLIFRCFIIKRPDFYMHLYISVVIPKLLYCVSVWRPHQRYILDRFGRFERKFFRRLNRRCQCEVTIPASLSILYLFGRADVISFKSIAAAGLLSEFFEFVPNQLRSGYTLSNIDVASLEAVHHSFKWRYARCLRNASH